MFEYTYSLNRGDKFDFEYARVSSKNQNLSRQLQDLEAYGCDRVYEEKQSGKDFDRPVYKEIRSKMRFGDA